MNLEILSLEQLRSLDLEELEARKDAISAAYDDTSMTEEDLNSVNEQARMTVDEYARRKNQAKVRELALDGVKSSKPIEERGSTGFKSLGDRVADEVQKRGINKDEKFSIPNIAFRANTDTQVNPALNTDYGADTLEEVDTNIRIGYRRPITVADLFSQESTSKDAVSFYTEGNVEGGPGMTAETGLYSQLHFGEPTKHTNSLKKITAFWKESDELISDSPRLVSHINQRAPYLMDVAIEDQLLSGNGTGNNITGLLNTTGILTDTYTALDLNFIDKLLDYRTSVKKNTPNFMIDTLLMADEDADVLLKLKNDDNQYVMGGPTNIVYGNNVNVSRVLWNGIRLVSTPALTSGTCVVGAFKLGATVIRHTDGRRFEMTNSNEDDFTHGLVTFRMSERLTLAVEYPKAFYKLTRSA